MINRMKLTHLTKAKSELFVNQKSEEGTLGPLFRATEVGSVALLILSINSETKYLLHKTMVHLLSKRYMPKCILPLPKGVLLAVL